MLDSMIARGLTVLSVLFASVGPASAGVEELFAAYSARNCSNISASLCEASSVCYLSSTSQCMVKAVVSPTKVVAAPLTPWCHGSFPVGLLTACFFLAMLLIGISLIGVVYHAMYYDVYTTVVDGERVYNQVYYNTRWRQMLLCGLLFSSCMFAVTYVVLMFVGMSSCAWYFITIIFLVVCVALPATGGCLYAVLVLVVYITRSVVSLELDDYVMPTSKQMTDRRKNQVRCF